MRQKTGSYGKIVVIILFTALVLGNYFQYQLSPLGPVLMEDMGLSSSQFSSVFSSPMIPAIFLGIIAGMLSDKYGVKRVAAIGLAVTALGLCLRPFAAGYASMMGTMILGGIGVTFLNVNMSKIIGGWYPPEKVGSMVGIAMVGSTLGMTVGTATTAMMPSYTFAFAVSGIAAVVVFVLWILFMKDGESGQKSQESPLESLKVVLKSRNIWLVGLCLMCVLGCNVAVSAFLPTALQSRGISAGTSGIMASVLTVGSLLGSLLGPAVCGRMPSMKGFLIGLGVIAGVCAAFGWMGAPPLIVVSLLLAGFCIGTLIPLYMSFPMLLPEIGPQYAGSAGGAITTLELLGAVIIPTYIITPIAGENFSLMFLLAGGCMILMSILVIFLPELQKNKSSVNS